MVARIITKSKKVETFSFISVNDNADGINPNIPTLIIGKDKALSIYPKEKIRIRDRNIEGKVWWTYSKLDKRDEYEEDLEKFNKYVLDELANSVKYISFNIIMEPFQRIKDMICYMRSNDPKYVYITDKQIYVYSKGVVFGISRDEMEYCNVNVEKTIDKMRRISSIRIVRNKDYDWYAMRKLNNKANFIVPYIEFLNNGDTFLVK